LKKEKRRSNHTTETTIDHKAIAKDMLVNYFGVQTASVPASNVVSIASAHSVNVEDVPLADECMEALFERMRPRNRAEQVAYDFITDTAWGRLAGIELGDEREIIEAMKSPVRWKNLEEMERNLENIHCMIMALPDEGLTLAQAASFLSAAHYRLMDSIQYRGLSPAEKLGLIGASEAEVKKVMKKLEAVA
jgi:hypothetical protein